ncbi:pyroglutamyl-peptidase I family protein [Bosea sp. (in: a-proteobacteria)]|uniref:pyroglutamyl-peptidase I family protein n=1 Tax=Bosea sp. (in: a-proteobacteria) TaxID=1871050 RepID=UPI002FCAB910
MDLLVTGFGPFPHVRVNPTEALARAVARRLTQAGIDARALVLETSYSGGLPALRRHLDQTRPRAVLMLGIAARARFVRVELFARGRSSRLHADARGATPAEAPSPSRGLPLRSTASTSAALDLIRRRGIRARLSPSAGRYLCDACYAAALASSAAGVPVIFIHVPWLRPSSGIKPTGQVAGFRPGPAQLAAALAALGRELASAGRRNARPRLG